MDLVVTVAEDLALEVGDLGLVEVVLVVEGEWDMDDQAGGGFESKFDVS